MSLALQQKESIMLNKTLLLSVIAVAVAAVLLIGLSPSVAADEKKFTFPVENALILGQGQGEARRGPTLLDRFRQGVGRLFQDDTAEHESTRRTPPVVIPPAVPTQPPKPVTVAEIQQSVTAPGQNQTQQGQQRAVADTPSTPQPRIGTTPPATARNNPEDRSSDTESSTSSTLARMQAMRDPFFTPELTRAAQTTRQSGTPPRQTTLSPTPTYFDLESVPPSVPPPAPPSPSENLAGFPDLPLMPNPPQNFEEELLIPRQAENRQLLPRDTLHEDLVVPGLIDDPRATPSQLAVQKIAEMETATQREPSRRLIVSASPRLQFEIEEPPSVVVNQEITHRIRVTNVGDAPAEGVVVRTEIPSWISVTYFDASNGSVVSLPREDGSGITDLEWKVNQINQGTTDLLVLRSVPQVRRAIEFPIRYDFYRPVILAKVEVREARLEMELLGPDEALWNEVTVYRLLVRNVGSGDAENVRLDLQQTSSEDSFSEMGEPLRPGESQELNIRVQAGREQEFIDIAVLATGAHDLRAETKRRIRVLRPKLEMDVQTLPLHFVDNSAEVAVRIRNVGTADADNVVIKAELPLGTKYVSSTEGGMYAVQQQQNMVEWRGKSIAKGEMQTFILVCTPVREGECRVSIEANEASGSLLVAGNGTFTAKAIVELDLVVNKPNGPVELGHEAEYSVQITNKGTKAAENVEVAMMFGKQLEPVAVEGGEAFYDDGQVSFEKIPMILPKQSITRKVVVRAEQLGTAPVRAEVTGTDIHFTSGVSTYIFSRQGIATASGQTQSESFR